MFSLIATGKPFIRDLEKFGALAVYAPLEGGFEGRYQRRLRATGYTTLNLTARGLGDLSAYLTQVHGIRPAHLGKKNIGQEAMVGPIYYTAPVATYQLENLSPKSKGLVLWMLEGFVLSREEIEYLAKLTQQETRLKVVLEMGGARYFRWQSLQGSVAAA
jgi:NAD(P)H-quinone oxidoreductase subunit N